VREDRKTEVAEKTIIVLIAAEILVHAFGSSIWREAMSLLGV